MTSSTVSSESVARQERRDPYSAEASEELLTKPTQHPKSNNNENHEQVREDHTGMVARIQRESCG